MSPSTALQKIHHSITRDNHPALCYVAWASMIQINNYVFPASRQRCGVQSIAAVSYTRHRSPDCEEYAAFDLCNLHIIKCPQVDDPGVDKPGRMATKVAIVSFYVDARGYAGDTSTLSEYSMCTWLAQSRCNVIETTILLSK